MHEGNYIGARPGDGTVGTASRRRNVKCPQCACDFNPKDAMALPRLGRVEATACAFCSSFVAVPSGAAGEPRLLGACRGCGSPVEGPGSSSPSECESCSDAVSREVEARCAEEEAS